MGVGGWGLQRQTVAEYTISHWAYTPGRLAP
jgi:hypothetical protein